MGTEKNYYDVLDIEPGATDSEIEEAYQRAKATYGQDSVALYSLYSAEEKAAILDEINTAYKALKDATGRASYSAGFTDSAPGRPAETVGRAPAQPMPDRLTPSAPTITLKGRPLATDEVDPVAAEQYRVLYTKLEHISVKRSHKSFALTSAVKGEGKTITSLNLAYTIANDFKKRVVLVECDLKKPSLLTYFTPIEGFKDIVDVIGGGAEIGSALLNVEDSGLFLMPARFSAKNSSELLGSRRLRGVLDTLKTEFDYVIVDSPPILHLADMNIISGLVDGLILVVRAGKTPKDLVEKAAKTLQSSNIAGVVLNGAEISLNRYYYR